ncbi:hypothetical protein FOS14_23445 [Skermania sp. ID1734]|nr:hypothetical protein FOS14_23445 [Skermania sp. ID1734]
MAVPPQLPSGIGGVDRLGVAGRNGVEHVLDAHDDLYRGTHGRVSGRAGAGGEVGGHVVGQAGVGVRGVGGSAAGVAGAAGGDRVEAVDARPQVAAMPGREVGTVVGRFGFGVVGGFVRAHQRCQFLHGAAVAPPASW